MTQPPIDSAEAWADRESVRPSVGKAAEATPFAGVGTASAVWNPRCACGEVAEAALAYIRNEGGVEEGRTRPKCARHLAAALEVWESIVTDEVHVLVVAA